MIYNMKVEIDLNCNFFLISTITMIVNISFIFKLISVGKFCKILIIVIKIYKF